MKPTRYIPAPRQSRKSSLPRRVVATGTEPGTSSAMPTHAYVAVGRPTGTAGPSTSSAMPAHASVGVRRPTGTAGPSTSSAMPAHASVGFGRPSGMRPRTESVEPNCASVDVGRLSLPATKRSIKRRSRSHQRESRCGQPATTTSRNNRYLSRTTAPVRTTSRGWQASLDFVLAGITVQDQRPIDKKWWQQAQYNRVQEALAARGDVGGPLVRPLTVARFVSIARALVQAITGDDQLNIDNYVAELPRKCQRLLYPGAVHETWLKAVNSPEMLPQALALFSYLLDLLETIEAPVNEDSLYADNDEWSQLRRDYLRKCFVRFHNSYMPFEYDDFSEEYLLQLKQLILSKGENIGLRESQEAVMLPTAGGGNAALHKENNFTEKSSDPARARKAFLLGYHTGLRARIHGSRLNTYNARYMLAVVRTEAWDKTVELKSMDADIYLANAESAQLCMWEEEFGRRLNKVQNEERVYEFQHALATEVTKKAIQSRETMLELWQEKILVSCVEYNKARVHLSAQFPQLAAMAVDETKLMDPSCQVELPLEALKQLRSQLQRQTRSAHALERLAKLEEARAAVADRKSKIIAAKKACEADKAAEAALNDTVAMRKDEVAAKMQTFIEMEAEFQRVHDECDFWLRQKAVWRKKISEMREYIRTLKEDLPGALDVAGDESADLIAECLVHWHEIIDEEL